MGGGESANVNCYRAIVPWRDEEVETLADIVDDGLLILFVGLNPALISVERCHYHQGRLGKQFRNLLTRNCIMPEPSPGAFHDDLLLENSLGITDLVKRPSKSAKDLKAEDIKYGRDELRRKIRKYKPKVVCSVYKSALEKLCEKKFTNQWGLLDEQIGDSILFALPFPFRPREEVDRYMRELRELIGKDCHD